MSDWKVCNIPFIHNEDFDFQLSGGILPSMWCIYIPVKQIKPYIKQENKALSKCSLEMKTNIYSFIKKAILMDLEA